MKHYLNSLFLLLLLTFVACNKSVDNDKMTEVGNQSIAPTNEVKTNESVGRKLIKEGQIEFATTDLQKSRKTIFEAVNKYKAYVSFDKEHNSPGRKNNILKIRIPSDNFDKLLGDAIKGVEKFERKEITVKDVSEEFLDVEARLKTKKELEQRYIELLKKAKNIPEILEVEKQIEQLRSEIESVEGRLRYLKDRVSFSTLSITFYEIIPAESGSESEFGKKLKRSLLNGWEGVIMFFITIANVWPLILIGLGVWIGLKFYWRKKR